MISPLPVAFLVTFHGLALGGFTSNAFIIAVIVSEWAKSRGPNSSELLLLSLGMSNICATVSMMATVYREHFNISHFLMSQVTNFFLSISTLSRFWFTAWLCVFYCIKIVNSTHSPFLWCKQRISWLLPWILVASAVISILSSVFTFLLAPVHLQSNTTTVNITDISQEVGEEKHHPFYTIFFLFIGSSCPLLVVLLCSIVTVASLCRHVCQMTGKESSFRSPQTEAHFKAAAVVLFLLFLYLSFFTAQIVPVATRNNIKIVFCVYSIVLVVYSLAQAAILVLVNPRLRQALIWMLPGRKP